MIGLRSRVSFPSVRLVSSRAGFFFVMMSGSLSDDRLRVVGADSHRHVSRCGRFTPLSGAANLTRFPPLFLRFRLRLSVCTEALSLEPRTVR